MAKAATTVPEVNSTAAVELTKPTLTEIPAAPADDIPTATMPASVALKAKLFPVRILKGYRPLGEFVMRPRADPENEFSERIERAPTADERLKVVAGRYCSLPLDEAKKIIKLGIAERDDEMTVD
jgi:hypothetical protein